MQEGSLPEGIPEWRVRVDINGTQRIAESVTIDADVANDLPDEVAGVSGVSARTGTINWGYQEAVSRRPATPWTRTASWPPRPGDVVGVFVGYVDPLTDEVAEWTKVFTGRIDSNSGGIDNFKSKIVDDIDQLDRNISLPPVAHTMPGEYDESTDTGASQVRTYVQPWHAAYRALRAAGFLIPAASGGSTALDVDFQGSVWPETGTLKTDWDSQETDMDWGDGYTYLSDGVVTYYTNQVTVPSGGGTRVWGRIPYIAGAKMGFNIGYANGRFIRSIVTIGSSMNSVTAFISLYDGDPARGGTQLATGAEVFSVIPTENSVWFEAYFPAGSPTASFIVQEEGVAEGTSNSEATKHTVTLSGQSFPAGTIMQAAIYEQSIQARVAATTTAAWNNNTSYMPASRVHAWGRGLVNSQYVSRTIEKTNIRDLLSEIGQATLTAMWIDEFGVMQWAPTNLIYLGTPTRTLTTLNDVLELGWEESLQATRRKVTADFEGVALGLSYSYQRTVYKADSSEALPQGVTEEFISPPDDEEWFGVDTSIWRVTANFDRFNRRKGSFFGGVVETGTDTYTWADSDYVMTMAQIGPKTWKLTHNNETGEAVAPITHPTDQRVRTSLRDYSLPIIRALGLARFFPFEVTGASTGPSWAPDLNMDLGAWAIEGHAQNVVNWVSARLSSPLITLTDLEIAYDPRIQLGDMITVESVTLLGMRVNCAVVGKKETHGKGSSMVLTVRVIATTILQTTYEEFEAAYTGNAYSALEVAWDSYAYANLESSPLWRI